MNTPVLPGSTIGVIGGGQLGRMLILAGRNLGYRFHVYEPSGPSPAGAVADFETIAPYDDIASLKAFARSVDVVTLEFENIPRSALDAVAAFAPVFPGPEVLHICQNRAREKAFLQSRHLPHVPFAMAESPAGLLAGMSTIGFPCVVKTADFGYDGKGQSKWEELPGTVEVEQLWQQLGNPSRVVVEKWIPHTGEFSVLCARGHDGRCTLLPVAENEHRHHILHRTLAPARLSAAEVNEVHRIALAVADKLDLVGLIAVELFRTADGRFLINELAPRPHNSGHYSIEACSISQFELLLRTVCGLPVPEIHLLYPAVMINLLGDTWIHSGGTPDWPAALETPDLHLHLYDKGQARQGRKMGHLTVVRPVLAEAEEVAETAFHRLSRRSDRASH